MGLVSKNLTYLSIGIALLTGCSSTTLIQEKPVLPEVPEYVKVPHPINFELSSLKTVFYHPLAPQDIQGEFASTCDSDYKKILEATNDKGERAKAAVELVNVDPEKMHWCFYVKISKLQDELQSDSTWSSRQKKVFDTYEFLAPIANAFQDNYHDSRYLRWAAQYYSKISEWVFFRKVQPLPDSTLSIVQGANASSLEPWVQIGSPKEAHDSIFTRYGISLNQMELNAERSIASQKDEMPVKPNDSDHNEAVTPENMDPEYNAN